MRPAPASAAAVPTVPDEDPTVTTQTDIQAFRPDAGDARPSLGSVGSAWPTSAAFGLTTAIAMANVKPSGYLVKRHDVHTTTGRPSEVST